MTDAVLALLRDLAKRDVPGIGIRLDESPARRKAMKDKLLYKRKMKAGHGYLYALTNEGRKLIND